MSREPTQALQAAKEAGREALERHPSDSDADKAHRAIEAHNWLIDLRLYYKRPIALALLDPNKNGGPKKPTMFGVSERHIRRVETIRHRRPKQSSRLEAIAKTGAVSLETIEHLVLHPSTDLVEVVWLVLDEK